MIRFKNYILVLLIFTTSCAKEIYTNEDATNSKRESQKAGLTVIIRDVSSQQVDMSGFKLSTIQCGELIEGFTTIDGIADLMVVKGDIALNVEKEGYVSAIAVITTNASEKERNNTVVIIPVFRKGSNIDIDINEFTGGKYQPGALTYSNDD